VVSKVRNILNEKKAGHAGTLDPMATGVLPVLIGKGTKLSKYLIEHNKKYVSTVYLGEKKDTGDIEGKTIQKEKVPSLTEKVIIDTLNEFKGKQKQIPPMYSAIKKDGKKLYEYARKGIEIERESRDIEIFDIRLLEFDKNRIKFEVFCSKGTYIRVLCEDIAERLGTVGYMSKLKRTVVDNFKIEDSISLDEILLKKDNIISIEDYFCYLNKINLNERKMELFLNGVKLISKLNDGLYRIYTENGIFIGLGIVENSLLKRDIVI